MSNSKNVIKRRPWPEKRRKKQAQNCRKTKPWKNTTGPRTAEGKDAVKRNAFEHGAFSKDTKELRKALFQQRMFLNSIQAFL